MTTHLSWESGAGGKIAVLTLDNPPVNSLSVGIRQGMIAAVADAQKEKDLKGIVVRGKGNAFCAGAEISEFSGGGVKTESLPDTLARLENASVPVVAIVHGFALGGGFEVALSCHYRLGTADSRVGLPEVDLGLLPGAGGTQRLPRLIGAVPSAEFMLSGKPAPANAALKLGIFDALVKDNTEGGRLKEAIAFIASKNGQIRRVSAQPVPDAKDADVQQKLDATLKKWRAKRRGEVAPEKIVNCVRAAIAKPTFAEGMEAEGVFFGHLLASPESRALQHMFFAERAGAKLPKQYQATPAKIKQVGIVGSGLMGGGIAMSCADVGLSVILLDAKQEFLDRGLALIKKNYTRSVERKSITQEQMDKRLSLLKPTLNYEDFKDCDIVVEAVFEDMKLKKDIFGKLDSVCKPGCILGTNTSGLNIDLIAQSTKRPEDVIGAHFFSPANVMKLLENVRGKDSSARTVSTAMAFGKKIGKVPILVGNCPGFVGNRMLDPYSLEAVKLIVEGAPIEKVDGVARGIIGMNMGPLAMNDLVGLQLFWRKRKSEGTARPDTFVPDALCEAGRFGQTNGKGYYQYKDGRTAEVDPEAAKIVAKCAENAGIARRYPEKITEIEIFERLMYPLINEGFKILSEGIASKASDIDVCYVYGYGFPRYRGGPMKLAEELGLDTVLAGLNKYRRQGHKEAWWTPSPLLEKLVSEKKTSLAKI